MCKIVHSEAVHIQIDVCNIMKLKIVIDYKPTLDLAIHLPH